MPNPGPPVDPLYLAFQLALAGRYSIDRELGRGGMGVVYLAREVHLDRMVAIKLLPPERATDTTRRDRFLREARLAAKLSHPNIIPIHSVDEAGEFVFYVMAFIDGETLAHRVRTRGPLTTSEGARILREVAWALGHAHSHGLVHRDVKPDNILLETSTGRVLVADFGIAAAARDSAGTNVSGTPEFMSPEQALGQEVDARSDLYGLGITAFYAFTGRLPFEGKSATEVLAKQVTEPAPPLSSMGVPVARKVALLVDRCVAKDPRQRPASADSLAEQLGVAIEQRREMPAALRAFVKRNSRLNGSGTMLAPFGWLAVGIAVSTQFGLVAGFSSFVLGMAGSAFAALVDSARGLLKLGFAHSDVAPAYATEIEQTLDERAVSTGARARPGLEAFLKHAVRLSGMAVGTGVVGVIALVSGYVSTRPGSATFRLWQTGTSFLFFGGLAVLVPATITWASMLDRRRDIDSDFWGKIWTGRIGKLAFGIARKFLGKGVRATAVTHRATELSLGMAAESLFESLPQHTRRALGNLPAVVKRLQTDAQRLRKLYDELQEAVGGDDTSSSAEHEELRAHRDTIHAKLGQAVGSLETIRLNLLRLHAGSGSVEGLTTHVDLAAEVSAEVERMLAARREVDDALAFPRRVAPTPA